MSITRCTFYLTFIRTTIQTISLYWMNVCLRHRYFVLIFGLAVFLRFYQFQNTMIFIGDAARDFFAANQMLQTGNIPLLGIPSSIPRFRQGPFSIWMLAFFLFVSHGNPIIGGMSLAFFSLATLVMLYVLLRKQSNITVALLASFLFTISPMAVAHSRLAFIITPLPFFLLLYIIALVRVHLSFTKKNIFLAGLGWVLVFQFELAAFPLIFLLIYIFIKKKISKFSYFLYAILGCCVGLFPQILYDLTHNFKHLGGFILWLGYRVVAIFGYSGEHTFTFSRFFSTLTTMWKYFIRIVSVDVIWISVVFLLLFFLSFFYIWKNRKQLPFIVELSGVGTIILIVAFSIHGAPSEAYFPPFLLFLPIIIAYGIYSFSKIQLFRKSLILFIILMGIWSTGSIMGNSFFVSTDSNFNYGPSFQEQKQVVSYILSKTKEDSYTLQSTDEGNRFPTYLDNYRFIAQWMGKKVTSIEKADHVFFIESKQSTLKNYPKAKVAKFTTVDVVQIY